MTLLCRSILNSTALTAQIYQTALGVVTSDLQTTHVKQH